MQLFLLRIQAVLPERMSFFIALNLAEVTNLKVYSYKVSMSACMLAPCRYVDVLKSMATSFSYYCSAGKLVSISGADYGE